jgi:hypothetical protein
MSTFVTSKGTRVQHVFPKYQSRPYRPAPGRREHIYGKIRPANDNRGRATAWLIIGALIIAAYFGGQLLRIVL